MKRMISVFAALLCLAPSLFAQQDKSSILAFGASTPDDRGSARVLYWDEAKNEPVGEFDITFGRPVWKKEYEDPAKFDPMTKGKTWRLGDNFWTTLDTNLSITIGGKVVAPGQWYLGLHRSEDGASWSLVFIDAAKTRAAKLDAFQVEQAPVAFKVPVSFGKAEQSVEKLTITLVAQKENLGYVDLKIAWGNMQLTAPLKVSLDS